MRTTKVLSVTLPDEMLKQAKRRAKLENRTMSELVREALRRYEFAQWLNETRAYAAERAAETGVMTEQQVVNMIHEFRRERRRKTASESKAPKSRKAS
jgi:CopG family transcriptional regulator/antitoxin EndoAI